MGRGAPCLIVAELGTSHLGEIARARELVEAAAESGADCAKLQLVHADEILHPLSGEVDLPTGRVELHRQFQALERPLAFYAELKSYAESKGLAFLCSAFGLQSARELRSIGAKAIKIASPELNHFPLLREAASYRVPLILSTGVSKLADIERALEITGRSNVVLLHCVTAYPAPEEEYNLKVLDSLQAIFGLEVGLSDHSLDPTLVPALAVLHGACVVEKHFTLSRRSSGLDDPIALEPRAFKRMAERIREIEGRAPSQPRVGSTLAASVSPERDSPQALSLEGEDGAETGVTAVFAALEREYGAERVRRVIGSGVKTLAPSERDNYLRTNRSVHALAAIPEGALIGDGDVAMLRTEKKLRPGLSPEFLHLVIGRRARRPIPAGEGVVWEDILEPPGT